MPVGIMVAWIVYKLHKCPIQHVNGEIEFLPSDQNRSFYTSKSHWPSSKVTDSPYLPSLQIFIGNGQLTSGSVRKYHLK